MSTSGRAAGVLGLEVGDGVDGVAAGAVEAGGGVALVDAAGETSGADDGALAGDVRADDAALDGVDVDGVDPDGVDPDGVALGET